jgi:MFS family permease
MLMAVAAPIGGRMSGRFGSKVPLVLGACLTLVAFVLLAVAHSEHWQVYLASALLGCGVGFSFASMANLIVEAVKPDQTGIATGMNAVMRTIGGAIGGQVAASLLAVSLLADGLPGENGYTLAFAAMALALLAAVGAALAVPGRSAYRSQTIALREPQASAD